MSYTGAGIIGSHIAHEPPPPGDSGMIVARDIIRRNAIGQTVIVVPEGQPIPAGLEWEPGEAKPAPPRSLQSRRSFRVICEWCDGTFRQTHGNRRYCGAKCRYAARDRKRHRPKGTQLAATCKQCGAGFEYVATTKPRLYCFTCSPRGSRFRVAAQMSVPSPAKCAPSSPPSSERASWLRPSIPGKVRGRRGVLDRQQRRKGPRGAPTGRRGGARACADRERLANRTCDRGAA
jgi:hypothetical protein